MRITTVASIQALSQAGISSVMDTWIVLANRENNGARARCTS